MFGRKWRITIISAKVKTTNNGSPWDLASSPPDPYFELTIGGAKVTSNTKSDTYSPVWNAYSEGILNTNTAVSIFVYDEDIGPDHFIDSWVYKSGVSSSDLSLRDVTMNNFTGGLLELKVKFEPQ